MTLETCTHILTALAITLGARMDVPTYRAYHRALQDVPAPLLEAAADAAGRTPRGAYEPTFPTPATLRAMAESCRQALVAAHPYRPGACCEGSGWQGVTEDGAAKVKRCACHQAHQKALLALGLGSPLLLSAAQPPEAEAEAFDPRAARVGSE